MKEILLIIDFGSQYTQLIARRVRELNVCSKIIPFNQFTSLSDDVKAVILSGSPASVNDVDAPTIELSLIRKKVPLLSLCYGAQLIAHDVYLLRAGGSPGGVRIRSGRLLTTFSSINFDPHFFTEFHNCRPQYGAKMSSCLALGAQQSMKKAS